MWLDVAQRRIFVAKKRTLLPKSSDPGIDLDDVCDVRTAHDSYAFRGAKARCARDGGTRTTSCVTIVGARAY